MSYNTLLITGGAGFIGSALVRQLAQRGKKLLVLDALTYAGNRINIEGIKGDVTLIEGDIADRALVARLLTEREVDAVIHMAAESHVDNSIHAPSHFIDTNIVGTYCLLETARHYWLSLDEVARAAFRFVQVSTDEVYGALGEEGVFTPDTPIAPNSPYSASKAAGDLLARAWQHTYGMPIITTRCSNNYGPRQHPEKLIPRMITRALAGETLPVYGSGRQVRDWIHVDDHARGIVLALERGVAGEVYLFGGHEERRNIEIITLICDELARHNPSAEYHKRITYVEDRLGHDFRYAIDDSASEKALGFTRTVTDFSAGLSDTITWYLHNQAWIDAINAHTQKKRSAA